MREKFHQEYLGVWVEPNEGTMTRVDVWNKVNELRKYDALIRHVTDHFRNQAYDEKIYENSRILDKYYNEIVWSIIEMQNQRIGELTNLLQKQAEREKSVQRFF